MRSRVRLGRMDECRPFLDRGLAIRRAVLEADDPLVAEAESALGGCLLLSGDREGAAPLLRRLTRSSKPSSARTTAGRCSPPNGSRDWCADRLGGKGPRSPGPYQRWATASGPRSFQSTIASPKSRLRNSFGSPLASRHTA